MNYVVILDAKGDLSVTLNGNPVAWWDAGFRAWNLQQSQPYAYGPSQQPILDAIAVLKAYAALQSTGTVVQIDKAIQAQIVLNKFFLQFLF